VAVYDFVTETVFWGTHFMARRMVLRPLAKAIQRMGPKKRGGRGLKLLDIGMGNGSSLLQVREAFPGLELHGLDLSPAMLDHAKQSFRHHPSMDIHGYTHSAPSTNLMRASMEDIPMGSGSFDFVTQTNCFHEMPESAIRNTASEVSRILKPGGMFLHLDAPQIQDDSTIASTSRVVFDKKFTEPFMVNWMENIDMDEIFGTYGLMPIAAPRPYFASTLRCYRKV
jgi:ubiquinone/menaquinone biosynthesis C-methylase UbiE